jgi:PhoH-like ATPase
MPLPKIPTKPGTLLPAADYPKAERGVTPVYAVAPAAAPDTNDADAPIEAVAQAAPAPAAPAKRTTRAKAAPLAAVPAPTKAAPVTKPAVEAPAPVAPRGKAANAAVPAAAPAPAPVTARVQDDNDIGIIHPAKHKPVEPIVKSSTSRKADTAGLQKLFVLDTNVLMHDPSSLFRFEEHDVYLPRAHWTR